jgi:hypothetical protein
VATIGGFFGKSQILGNVLETDTLVYDFKGMVIGQQNQ